FFIRYGDPQWHLRVRVFGDPDVLRDSIQLKLLDALREFIDSGFVWRVQFDTYQREVERYGGDEAMLLTEKAFHADSTAVAGIVAMLSGDAGLDARWRLALAGTDRLLADLGFDIRSRASVVRAQRDGFAKE